MVILYIIYCQERGKRKKKERWKKGKREERKIGSFVFNMALMTKKVRKKNSEEFQQMSKTFLGDPNIYIPLI